ncbi:MAG: hypothetical protein CMP76_17525 [Flavobacterium sp.]|uniref:DUF4294 domain-containing protein n=1 Tax=unclassified Flavobacterium TaxID=196869 RepID=UPI000C472A91|nr:MULTISPECIES: DUF4294 domain-containing protein [unclassified Flavobacterium]MBF05081.1 hypothetical protein [Flavobacterium sp.]MCO6164526.1 DUF4294 domain-containing protein [Flavobacterium sp. NRK F7]|tara:strand:+ start:2835 stop:3524 length:690 start_codon:yes stop_codon:yes gene_type:complete
MKNYIICLFVLTSISLKAQIQDTLRMNAQDSTLLYSIQLDEIVVSKNDISGLDEERKKLLILKRRVYKTYPYAKLTSEKLLQLNATMAKLKTKKEKKKYFKIVEKYLQEEFEPKLKKLSRKDGQILVKLINRQTGETTFDLIKEYKSGWKAFWSNNTAKLFDINIKEEYKPYDRLEDFHIESILVTAFRQGSLENQASAKPIDLTQLASTWKEKIKKMKEERLAKEDNN